MCFRSWCTGHCVHISLRMGQCVLGLSSWATVFQILVHGPLCARSWCTSHCVLGPGARTGHCALGLGVDAVLEVFVYALAPRRAPESLQAEAVCSCGMSSSTSCYLDFNIIIISSHYDVIISPHHHNTDHITILPYHHITMPSYHVRTTKDALK